MSGTTLYFKDVLSGPFHVTGRDAERYLHGRLTQDIKTLQPGSACQSFLLSPQGRVQGHLVVLREGDSFLLFSDRLSASDVEGFVADLLCFRVADDVELTDLSSERCLVLALHSHSPARARAPLEDGRYSFPFSAFDDSLTAELYIGAPGETSEALLGSRAPGRRFETEGQYEQLRVCAGRPCWGAELTEKTLGPEVNLTHLASFTKGCYAGQEVVEMAQARGRVNRTLHRLTQAGGECPRPGASIATGDDVAVGIVTSACPSPVEAGNFCGLAFIKTAADLSQPLFLDAQPVVLR